MTEQTLLDYSPEAMDWIAERVGAIQERNSVLNRNTIVGITGGSSTGKSTQIVTDLHRRLKPASQIISQDHFQLGVDYKEQADPIYQWDALANYGIPEGVALLRELQQGRSTEIPVYSFRDFRRMGFQRILPTPIVLFEGLYAGFGELRSVADLIIYVETPLYARMIRRVFRSCFERYRADPTRAMKSFLNGGVLRAHRDLVQQQRQSADIVLQMPYQFAETLKRFPLEKQLIFPSDTARFSFPIDGQSLLQVVDKSGELQIQLFHQDNLYFSFPIDDETYQSLINTALTEY